MGASSIRIRIQIEKILTFPFHPKIAWARHEFEFEFELRKFQTFAFLPTITWVPH